MKPDYVEFQDRSIPLGYLITIRCYGTWLHGDERESMDRKVFNKYGGPKIPAKPGLERSSFSALKSQPFELDSDKRRAVKEAIYEVCEYRGFRLFAINARTNHVHIVLSANAKPELIMNSFKSYATRKMRSKNLVSKDGRVWSRHGSTKYLWTDEHIESAVDYVVNGQGADIPDFI